MDPEAAAEAVMDAYDTAVADLTRAEAIDVTETLIGDLRTRLAALKSGAKGGV